MNALEIRGLTASYGPTTVLRDIDFTVEEGEFFVILGANGAGKTTTLRSISGTVRRSGMVKIFGTDTVAMSTAAIVRSGVAHVPQGRGVIANLTVLENLRLGAYVRRDKAVGADLDKCLQMFPVLAQRRRQQAGNLSGGEQQMLAISVALMLSPRLLILDEPSLGLAPLVTHAVFETLAAINRERHTTVVVVEQNANISLAHAGRAVVLETGRVVLEGSASSLQADEGVRRAYLGY
jgi:branched-chain amino acid transport system ATP-binding protein